MESSSNNRAVIENTTILLNCQAVGNPIPIFTWYHNGLKINKANYLSPSPLINQIMLSNISSDNAGNYTCFSQNVVGNATQSVEIVVYSKYGEFNKCNYLLLLYNVVNDHMRIIIFHFIPNY